MSPETWGGKRRPLNQRCGGGKRRPLDQRQGGGGGRKARRRENSVKVKDASGLDPGSGEKLYKVTVVQPSRAVGPWQSKKRPISGATEVKCGLVDV